MSPLGRALQCYYWKCCSQMKASWLWGRIFWGLAKASGVNRLALLCVVLKEWYIAQCWCFISIMMTKSSSSKEIFLLGNIRFKHSHVHFKALAIMSSLEKNVTPNLCAKLTVVFNDSQELKKKGNRWPARFVFMLVIQARFKICL